MNSTRAKQVTSPASGSDSSPTELSRVVVALTGAAFLGVGWSFSYLDRSFGTLGIECASWLIWALLGFGVGVANAGRATSSGQTVWKVMGWLGFILALVMGLPRYSILRWATLTLMVVMGARAAVMQTRRDFHLILVAIFSVSFVVGTHPRAEWTLWVYLGPAWLFAALALAWDHATDRPLNTFVKVAATTGFVAVSGLLALLLFLFVPRPPILGFGFLPPGTDTPGMFKMTGGAIAEPDQRSADVRGRFEPGGTEVGPKPGEGKGPYAKSEQGDDSGAREVPSPGEPSQYHVDQWHQMLDGMDRSTSDMSMPEWQRGALSKALKGARALVDALEGTPHQPSPTQGERHDDKQLADQVHAEQQHASIGLLLFMLLLLWLAVRYLWRHRYSFGSTVSVGCASVLARHAPARSMQFSALALKWCLCHAGCRRLPRESVREHWQRAMLTEPVAKIWLGECMEIYCAGRFGGRAPTSQQAVAMCKAVADAHDVLRGRWPVVRLSN